MPGVSSLGGVTSLPTQVRSSGGYWVQGGPTREQLGTSSPIAIFNVVTPSYLPTMQIPLRSGRDFTDADRQGAQPVAIINEALARAAFPGQDPVGRWIVSGLDSADPMTIVGVAGDVRTGGPALPARPEIYMPNEQHMGRRTSMTLVARTSVANPTTLVKPMRRLIHTRDPSVPVLASTMEGTLERALQPLAIPDVPDRGLRHRGAAAGCRRDLRRDGLHRESADGGDGLRMALGASRGEVLRTVVGQGAASVGIGLALGVALALGAGRLLRDLLFGVTPSDPLVLVAVVAIMALVALVACVVPGRRRYESSPRWRCVQSEIVVEAGLQTRLATGRLDLADPRSLWYAKDSSRAGITQW